MSDLLRQAWERRQQQLDDTAADRLRARAGDLSKAWKAVQLSAPAPAIVVELNRTPRRRTHVRTRCPAVHEESGLQCRMFVPHRVHKGWTKQIAAVTWPNTARARAA